MGNMAFCLLLCLPSLLYAVDYNELPDLGSSADVSIPPHLERRLSRAVLRQVSRVLYDDPQVSEYLDTMGEKLLAAAGENADEFTFVVINDTRINAFAAPGGVIGMNIGTFLNAERHSELAAVMAHEIAHITQKHSARGYGRRSGLQAAALASLVGGILLSSVNSEVGRAAVILGQAGVVQSQIDFTRDNEKEADRVGMQVLVKSGYDPHGMPAFFGRLLKKGRFYSQSVVPEFLRTHPIAENRIAESEERAAAFTPIAEDAKEDIGFLLVKAGLQLLQKSPARQAEVFFRERMSELEQGSLQYKAAKYGRAMALIEAREYEQAEPLVLAMLTDDGERMEYLVAASLLQMRRGNMSEGLLHLRKAQSRQPEHSWPVLVEAAALINAGLPDDAQKVLRRYGRFQRDLGIPYYEMLARAEEDAGYPAESALALAEIKYLQGRTKSAMKLLRATQSTADLSRYQRQRLQARIVQLEDEYKLEKKLKIEEKDEDELAGKQQP